MGVFIGAIDQDRRPRHRRDPHRPRAGLFRGGAGRAAGQAAAGRLARPVALLRGDRQARRRADPLQDRRSTSCCATDRPAAHCADRHEAAPIPLPLAQALIRCPSVTPGRCRRARRAAARAGAARLHLHAAASSAETPGRQPLRPPRHRRPASLLRRPYRRGAAGRWRGWTDDPFAGEVRDGVLYGRGACDMKGGDRRLRRRRWRTTSRERPDHAGSISLLITGDEEGPAVDGTAKVLEWMQAQRPASPTCAGRRADQPGRGSAT